MPTAYLRFNILCAKFSKTLPRYTQFLRTFWRLEEHFIFFIYSVLMLTITEQILFAIKNTNEMLIDVNTLVKKLFNIKHFI